MAKIYHVQPALPRYRLDFFKRLSARYGTSMKVIYSPGSLGALTEAVTDQWAVAAGPIRSLPFGMMWQSGVAWIPVGRGDIVALSGNPRYLSTLLLLVRAKMNRADVIWWSHYWSSTSRRWRQILRHLPMALADAILFYTDEEVEAFQSDGFLSSRGRFLAALNNGIDIEPIQRLRCKYHARGRDNALLFVGRLTEKAGLDIALEAMALLQDKAPLLHVIGDGEKRADLQSRARDLGLDLQIVWHGALTDEVRIAEVANRCRAFLYPGEVGLSLIHAMAYTLPSILHNQRRFHMPEIAAFRDGITGLSFAHDDADALAATIKEMVADNDRLDNFAEAASRVVGPSFTTENMADRFAVLIERLRDTK